MANRDQWDGTVFARDQFDAILSTVRFTPTTANDSPGAGPKASPSPSPAPS